MFSLQKQKRIRMYTHNWKKGPELVIVAGQAGLKRVDVEHGTYLTIDWGRDVHNSNATNHCQKTGHTRDGVNLPNERISPQTQSMTNYNVKHRILRTHIVHR